MANLIAYQSGNFTGTTTFKGASTATNAAQLTNTSSTNTTTTYVYSSSFSGTNGQTLEGILLYCNRVNTTGTVSVAFSADNGVTATREVTINASDLPASPSWVFFKFASTYAEGNVATYKVGVKSSSAGNATFYRDATAGNWARLLRRAATATAAASDVFYICDEWTAAATKTDVVVTMNSTSSATTYGAINIGQGGVLSYGTTAATNYHLKLAGTVSVFADGTFNIGTVATPIPRDSTAKLEFASTSPGQYGVEVLAGGTFVAQGLSRTSGKDVYYALLNTDEIATQTVLGVNTDTGWLNGDQIVIASTGSTNTHDELRTLSANATATTMTVSAGLSFAHSGTAPTQGEVALLTRNVQIFGASLTNTTYLLFQTTASVDMDWVQIYWIGSGTANKYGIDALTTTGSCSMQYCSIANTATTTNSTGFRISGATANNITLSNNVFYDIGSRAVYIVDATSGTSLTITNNIFIKSAGNSYLIWLADVGCTFSGNRIGSSGNGWPAVYVSESNGTTLTVSNCVFHNFGAQGIQVVGLSGLSVTSCDFWHGNRGSTSPGGGIVIQATSAGQTAGASLTATTCNFLGHNFGGIWLSVGGDATLTDCTFAGTTTAGQSAGLILQSAQRVQLNSCTFRGTSGIYVAHSTGDIWCNSSTGAQVILSNCALNASSEVVLQTAMSDSALIGSAKHDQTAGSHKAWKRYGTITTDTTIYKTASPSERLTPNNASGKLESGSKLVAIANGTTKTISVWVRESVTGDGTDYNGNRIRLRYRRNDAAGLTSDGTIATATVSSEGAWQQLSGTTPSVTDDCVLEFFVDCDGTTGWVNVDDYTIS